MSRGRVMVALIFTGEAERSSTTRTNATVISKGSPSGNDDRNLIAAYQQASLSSTKRACSRVL